ncbi:hypothetical protein B0H21DRAFT_894321 [Amylocystis lapponica]|nr:hypothetical protein B0H21DRAFT_894321 [Amylocystis lapponica]
MDDLYANAWNDPTEPIPTSKSHPGDSWISPRLPVADEEADLAAPSWSTGAGIQWNEPSQVPTFSWSQPEPDLAWSSSTYDTIRIAKTSDDLERPLSPSLSVSEDETGFACTAFTSPVVYSPDLSTTLPSSPDVFGTFESAFSSDDQPSYVLEEKTLDADAWGSPWVNAAEESTNPKEAGVDEWEAAKEQKAKQDRKVPPEVLADILDRCSEFFGEVWPEPKDKPPASEKDAWRNDRRSGMEGVEGLDSFVRAFLPPLSLKPPGHFGKTHIAKKMATSVRLTKNLPMTKGSPMSHYLAAKGSTAWETAGWRIVEPSTAATPDPGQGKKPTGRLFSFWSRRESNTHTRSPSRTEEQESIRSTQTESAGSPVDDAASGSRRSRDSIQSLRASIDKVPPPIPVSPSLSPSTATPPPMTARPVSSHQTSSYSDAPDPVLEPSDVSATAAPTAVSRFFNRFSRRSSTGISTRSPRSSLALSSDDLEFLSDIVPSASDDTDDDPEASTRSLAQTLKAQPLPPTLPPPPSAQPHRLQFSKIESVFSPGDDSAVPESGGVRTASSMQRFSTSSTPGLYPSSSQTSIAPILQPTSVPLRPSRPQTPLVLPTSTSKHSSRPTSPLSPSLSPEKPASQPFFLPSPPSSRAQTPVSSMPLSINTQSSPPGTMLKQDRPPSVPLARSRPKPPPFGIPPASSSRASSRGPAPSSASTSSQSPSGSPSTPSSARPLAELYPMASRSNTVQQQPAVTIVTPPFILAPPPSTRSYSQPPMLPPPPSSRPALAHASASSKPAPITVDLFDDDDFSDFHSPTILSSLPVPSSSLNSHSPFSAPFSGKSHASSALLPPSSGLSSSSSAWKKTTVTSTPSAFDDDDFSDFRSFNTGASAQSFESPSFGDSLSSENAFLAPHKTSGFDVSDAPSPMLRTPSPPRPPAKAPPRLSIAPPKLQLPGTEQPRKKVHTAEHQHTLSLMERAAARPGRWPAPPSPLPQALAFPLPISGPGRAKPVDLLGDDSVPDAPGEGAAAPQSASALLSPTRAVTGLGMGAVPLLPAPTSQPQTFDPFASLQRTATPPGASKPALPTVRPAFSAVSQTAPKNGGLSAQDLSFFEGL